MSDGSCIAQPWVEKYRPKEVSQVAHQEEVVKTLTQALQSNNLPHLLFYGPPGTGKTTTGLAIAHQLYGPSLYSTRVMELNASDERGINVVRHKIKQFAAQAIGNPAPGYPSPPFKIIILDEADAMTEDAQNALRRTMELYTKVTRFIFICNYVTRIIEPIASRCAKFRFKPLVQDAMTDRINFIAESEGLTLDPSAMPALAAVAGGDMRKAVTTLQSASRLFSAAEALTGDGILEVAGSVPAARITELLHACNSGHFEKMSKVTNQLMKDGYPVLQVLHQFSDELVQSEAGTDEQKAQILIRMAEVDKCLVDGADESLQLLDCMSLATCALNGQSQIGAF